ncbi:MAG: lipase family protein [Gammaproteobacteria bacterium]
MLSCVIATASATDTDGIDFSELYEQAEFAAAAYRPEAEIRALAEERGYTLTLHHTLEATQVAFFLATGEAAKTQLISIRGTSNVVNAMLDISVKLKPDADTGLRLHEGFAAAAKQVFEEVKPLLLQGYRIRLTGHSLGGAVASILALYLDKAGFDLARVVTFGQPKFTNIAGAAEFRRIDLIRVVTPADLVPLLPPFDPLDIKDLDVYWHAGTEVVLLADTEYAVLDGIDSMLRATRFTRQTLSEENLAYHRMALYLEMIAPKTGGAVRVPYPTDFNIFNIFGG